MKSLMLKKSVGIFFVISFFFFAIFPQSSIHGLRTAFLPVRLEGSAKQEIAQEKQAQLSRLYQTVWQLSKQKPFSLVDFRFIDAALKKLKTTPFTRYTNSLLGEIAQETDSDALVLSQLSVVNNDQEKNFKLTTSVFYTQAALQTDYITTQCSRLVDCFYQSMKKRYPQISFAGVSGEQTKKQNEANSNWVLLIDGSSSNQKEITALANYMTRLSLNNASVCVLFPNGQISRGTFHNKPALISFLKQIKTQAGGSKQNFSSLISCALKQTKLSVASLRPRALLLTGNSPTNEVQARGLMRQLASSTRLTILSTGSLNGEGLNFWKSLFQELQYAQKTKYKDILYRQKVGFSDGREFYIFKQGNRLVESNDKFLDKNDFSTQVPAHKANQFSAANLLNIYIQMSEHHLASHSNVEIVIPSLSVTKNDNRILDNKNIRVLFEMNGKPFWISLPASLASKVQKNDWYYVLVSLQAPANGIPFANNSEQAWVFEDKNKTSSLLLLSIEDYLKNPQRFLYKSMDGSSWYYIFGQVKTIRFP